MPLTSCIVVQSALKLAGNEFLKKTVCEDDTDSDSEKFSFQVDKSVKRFWSTVLLPLNGLTNDINKCTWFAY